MTDMLGKTDDELIVWAVKIARSRRGGRMLHPKWVAVMDTFGVGATLARNLCARAGIDPNAMENKA